ncbi:threonine transporter RhtB [Shewanella mangrovi]|uniref:Threonine transporter RhtB n=1 Tax=Shewanella mangrovi TaxID=1515746 RepID=A0A094JL25_9GAMM|nr:LysE family transporter [Shewanella mangrovi]KFZ38759.1 threonine transporter RhtB [Shewanella mangrovi]
MFDSQLFPAAFPALALAHFVALLSPGQDFFLIVAHAIRHRLPGARFICLGIALGNGIYIAIAIIGWSGIRDNPQLFSLVEILGALYLMWVGFKLLQSKPNNQALAAAMGNAPATYQQLLLGFNSALLNPKNALFYMSLMTVILGRDVTTLQQISCGVWMFFAVLLWDLLIAAIIGQQKIQGYLQHYVHRIEHGAGVILLLFAVALFARVQ